MVTGSGGLFIRSKNGHAHHLVRLLPKPRWGAAPSLLHGRGGERPPQSTGRSSTALGEVSARFPRLCASSGA